MIASSGVLLASLEHNPISKQTGCETAAAWQAIFKPTVRPIICCMKVAGSLHPHEQRRKMS